MKRLIFSTLIIMLFISSCLGSSICGFRNKTYPALVNYYNPKTDYSATYSLRVKVKGCKIVQINFPKGGYLDEDHINYADLDDNGLATVEGEDGKVFEVQIEY